MQKKKKPKKGDFEERREGEVSMALRKLRAAAGLPGPDGFGTGWKFAKNFCVTMPGAIDAGVKRQRGFQ